jgi:hypothetical protein
MAWEKTKWACGHEGAMQLYGKQSGRDSAVAAEAGRDCMACWLVGQWEKNNDPRAKREDRYKLAGDIAKGKDKRIYGLPESVPVKQAKNVNPLSDIPTANLVTEIIRRRTAGEEIAI